MCTVIEGHCHQCVTALKLVLFHAKKGRNTITTAAPRVSEITWFSDTVMAKGHPLLSSHKTEIISAGLIYLHLHNISVAERCGWALIIDTTLCIILIIKGDSSLV